MEIMFSILQRVTKVLNIIGGTALTFMMFLTVADVLMRAGGYPILGTYEMVALSLAIVIGLVSPRSHWTGGTFIWKLYWRSSPRGIRP
jgi:TRAP-type C4-dicarboxylate transport system permease small subunit